MAVKLIGSNVIVNRDSLYCAQGQRFTPSCRESAALLNYIGHVEPADVGDDLGHPGAQDHLQYHGLRRRLRGRCGFHLEPSRDVYKPES